MKKKSFIKRAPRPSTPPVRESYESTEDAIDFESSNEEGGILPWDHDMNATAHPYKTLAPVFQQILEKFNVEESPYLMTLIEAWPRLLPPDLAANTRPIKLQKSILYVAVRGATRLYELRRLHMPEIEAAVRSIIPDTVLRSVHLIPE